MADGRQSHSCSTGWEAVIPDPGRDVPLQNIVIALNKLVEQQSSPSGNTGRLILTPPSGATINPTVPWLLSGPYGSVSIPATTSTGLQEALNLINTSAGYSLDVYGYGRDNNGLIAATSTIIMPPLRNQYVRVQGTQIAQTSNDHFALKMDSMVEASFDIYNGQIYTGNGGAIISGAGSVWLAPRTTLPVEGFIGIASSYIRLGNSSINATSGATSSVLLIDLSAGGIVETTIEALELNSAGAGATPTATRIVFVSGAGGSRSFSSNIIRLNHVHMSSGAAIQIGANATEGANIFGNTWDIAKIAPKGASSDGLNTYGHHDTFRIGEVTNEEGHLDRAIVLESSAKGNIITATINDDTTGADPITSGVVLSAGATGNVIIVNTNGTITNPIQDSSGGLNFIILNGQPILSGLPTSAAGLATGSLWNSTGVVHIA